MCGIAGIVLQPQTHLPDLSERLGRMAQAMQHRGPDDQGIYLLPDGRGGLVNRRLAIRDLSAAGHMPMGNAAENIWITYNGELYNTERLRSELEQAGMRFRSTSDTEVILHGYARWGSEVVKRLRGMFAFAILDLRPEHCQLFLARDPLGIKPLYYAQSEQGFLFGSELKTILAAGLVSQAVSAAGLVGYLMMGSVPNPLTIYRGIQAMPPASTLTIACAKPLAGTPSIYWQLPTESHEPASYAAAVEQVQSLLAESVRSHLVSDVPLGAFLSGGLDSSGVVALMRQATSGTIRTCSMIFEEADYSEARYARAMAEHVGSEHYERVITAQDLLNEFDTILGALDQPSLDGVNSYFVSKTAREAGLTVALSGLGADELFGGYANTFGQIPTIYRGLQLAQRIPGASRLAQGVISQFHPQAGWMRIHDALGQPASLASAYLTRRGLFAPSEVQAMVHPDLWHEAQKQFDPVQHVAERAGSGGIRNSQLATRNSQFSWISHAELSVYMHHQLLRDTDVMSMAHSLEVRVPLVDQEVVTAILQLAASVKMGRDKQVSEKYPKPLLHAALAPFLPSVVKERQTKQGFTFPFEVWLRKGMQQRTQSILESVTQNGWLQPTVASQTSEQFQHKQVHWSRLWALVALGTI